jgi:hypothetical protein
MQAEYIYICKLVREAEKSPDCKEAVILRLIRKGDPDSLDYAQHVEDIVKH